MQPNSCHRNMRDASPNAMANIMVKHKMDQESAKESPSRPYPLKLIYTYTYTYKRKQNYPHSKTNGWPPAKPNPLNLASCHPQKHPSIHARLCLNNTNTETQETGEKKVRYTSAWFGSSRYMGGIG